MAAQVPRPYKCAGYGKEWELDDYIRMVPSGKKRRVSLYHYCTVATFYYLSQSSNRPSLCNFFPKMVERDLGREKSLGITADLAKIICLFSNLKPPHYSPIIMKFGLLLHIVFANLTSNGLG